MWRRNVFLPLALAFCLSVDSAPLHVKFLTFNVWQDGRHVKQGKEKIADVVKAVSPDVVCFSEVREAGWGETVQRLLAERGLNFQSIQVKGADVCLLSRFPVKESNLLFSKNNSAVKHVLLLPNGKRLVVVCAHLDYKGYACNLPRGYASGSKTFPGWKKLGDGKGPPRPVTNSQRILANNAESRRVEQIRKIIDAVKGKEGPVVVLGDFNEPSFKDWTKRTRNLFAHNGAVVEWPCTRMLEEAGFKDAFRVCFPDEVKNPGITWPSVFEGGKMTTWCPESDDRDRVDYVFYRGKGLHAVSVALVGPPESYAQGKPTRKGAENERFLASTLPWPSDHKAVFAVIEIP